MCLQGIAVRILGVGSRVWQATKTLFLAVEDREWGRARAREKGEVKREKQRKSAKGEKA
jgi:hypothetical protein